MSNYVTKTEEQVVEDVRVCYDEIADNDGSMVDEKDESELETIIKSKIGEALDFVLGNCSPDIFKDGDIKVHYEDALTVTDSKSYVLDIDGTTELADYLRPLWVKCSSWLYAVRDIYAEGDPDISWAFDSYCGATHEKPVVISSHRLSGTSFNRVLEIVKPNITSETSAGVTTYTTTDTLTLAYIPKITVGTTGVKINSTLYSAVVYYICGLVATTFGEKDRAQEFMELAVSMMGIQTNANNNQ